MKYKRLTKRISDDEEAFLFHSSLHEAIERLAELEDKIGSGELVSKKETAENILGKVFKAVEEARLESEYKNDKGEWVMDEGEFMSDFTLGSLLNLFKEYDIDLFHERTFFYTDNDGKDYECHIESECGEEVVIELSNGLKLRVNKEELR